MLNRSIIIGRLAADPEHRKTNSGKDNVTFTLCCERDGKNQEGNRDVDYIRCVAWNKTAENIAKYCTKGTLVAVEGRIQTRNYKNGDGFLPLKEMRMPATLAETAAMQDITEMDMIR